MVDIFSSQNQTFICPESISNVSCDKYLGVDCWMDVDETIMIGPAQI